MKKKTLVLSGILIANLMVLSAQSLVRSRHVLISAKKGWQDSGIKLKKDQFYQIYARGSWISGYGLPANGPEGSGKGTISDNALVGFIADSRPQQLGYESYKREILDRIIIIRRGGLFKAYQKGTLWLGMGEWSGCEECDGSVEVLIVLYD
ncbi:MAG: hypothetical protein GF421_01580 [Candidatus Aminicenantes bacterium]|nr:hypothetical protein [Candidatus Aminicenantes bacterium]